MANASKKHFGAGSQGKHAGTGAMVDVPKEMIGENQVLSNRDKKQHTDQRGNDSKGVQIDEMQDTATNHVDDGAV